MRFCPCDRTCDPPPGPDGICFRCRLPIEGLRTTAEELRAMLAVLTEAAPALRAAGVTQVEHGTLRFTLAALPPTLVIPQKDPVLRHEAALEAVAVLARARGAGSQ
jgi:hypothetical protein